MATLKIAIQVVWTISVVGAATFFSAPYGWQQHGFVGALALGSVGFALSAVVAASPALVLQLLR
ncbi:hypothetical protein AB7783_05460 [Tardiphaga sp. 172_B4_N1_3]|uniref:hypothetical protein n=1 Tax=Tardiphaga sp. 172_B4_N1_3 TaxID=3240787 RepID=UPI003F8AB257